MGNADFIDEAEAARLSGVSENTLYRFAEAGYFQVEMRSDNSKRYPRGEIIRLFGASPNASSDRASSEVAPDQEAPTIQTAPVTPPTDARNDNTDSWVSYTSAPLQEPARIFPFPGTDLFSAEEDGTQDEGASDFGINYSAEKSLGSEQEKSLELQRFELICEMQEKLLSDREQRIGTLEKEIQWLHERLEKAEQKSDRDQVLLLSETQLLRQFLENQQQQRRSSLRTLLEWMGMATPERARPQTRAIGSTIISSTEDRS